MTVDGIFIGIHGAARDVSERERLERDLRRQAGELAVGEERAHLARELHDSVTQALFSMTLVSRSVELLLDRDPAAAHGRSSAQLRDLQREALAEMRALIFELRPGNLEQDGLVQRAADPHAPRCRAGSGCRSWSTSDARRAPAAGRRGGPLPDRAGGAPQRRQARRRAAGPARRSSGRGAASACGSATTARASTRRASRTATSAWPGCAPGPSKIGATFAVESAPGEGTTIEVVVPDAAIAAGRDAPPAGAEAVARSATR